MKVKALLKHMNGWGDKFEKEQGDCYDLPDEHAGPLIDAGLAEQVADEGEPAPEREPGKGRGAKG